MKLSIKKLAEQIEASNEVFNNMSKSEKRVQIARDCLDRIKLKQFIPTTSITCGIASDWSWDNGNKSIKEILAYKSLPECHACAKGGLFLAYVGRTNEFNVGDITDNSALHSPEMIKLREIFEADQLELIETAFEGGLMTDQYIDADENYELIEECAEYRDNIDNGDMVDDTEALKSICKNIIKNNGEFVPTNHVSPNAKIK